MQVNKTKKSAHCELCSFEAATNDVLCSSCREMIGRLSLIASRRAQEDASRSLAGRTATKQTAAGHPGVRVGDTNPDIDISRPLNWRD